MDSYSVELCKIYHSDEAIINYTVIVDASNIKDAIDMIEGLVKPSNGSEEITITSITLKE